MLVICPAFVSDCLETIEEIGIRGCEEFMAGNGENFTLIPCMNEHPAWIDALEKMAGKFWRLSGGNQFLAAERVLEFRVSRCPAKNRRSLFSSSAARRDAFALLLQIEAEKKRRAALAPQHADAGVAHDFVAVRAMEGRARFGMAADRERAVGRRTCGGRAFRVRFSGWQCWRRWIRRTIPRRPTAHLAGFEPDFAGRAGR